MARFSLEEGNAERRKRSRVGRREEEACSKRGENSELGEGDVQERTGIDENEVGVGREGAEDEAICHQRGESSGDAGVCVRIDPDVLDCTICFEPLQPPIFQCQNGHVACPSCCSKLSNKCHMCSQTIRHSRCVTLEKVIESIKFSCTYDKYGCHRTMPYTEKYAHEKACSYAPCFCPVDQCYFGGSREMLSAHFINEHTPYFKELRKEPEFIDTFVRTFQKKDKTWSGDRVRVIKERYDQLSLSQRISGDDGDNEGSEPSVRNNLDLWLEASGGAKGGRILGMGSMSRIYNVPRRSLSSTPPAVTAQIHNLTEEVSNLKGIIFERDQQILEIQQQNSQRDQEMIEMRRQQAFLIQQFQQFSSGPSQIPPGTEDDGSDNDDID